LVCEINTEDPLGGCDEIALGGPPTLEALGDAYQPTQPDGIKRFIAGLGLRPASTPFCRQKLVATSAGSLWQQEHQDELRFDGLTKQLLLVMSELQSYGVRRKS
jgi:hypothetical protein